MRKIFKTLELVAAVSLALTTIASAQSTQYRYLTGQGKGLVVTPSSTPSVPGGSTGTPTVPASPSTPTTPTAPVTPAPVTEVTLSAQSLSFSAIAVGSVSGATALALLNSGTTSVAVTAPTVSGPFNAVTDCASTLAIAGQCSVNVTFSPTTYGSQVGSLTIPTGAGIKSVALTGTGLGSSFQVTGSPANSISYPLTYAGNTQETVLTLNVLNRGNAPGTLALPALTGTTPADFKAASTCSSVQADQTCAVTLSFAPQSEGAKSASFTLQGFTVSLSGTAYPAPTKGVNFAGMINGARVLNPASTAYYGPSPYSSNVDVNCQNSSWYVSSMLCTNNTVGTQAHANNAATTWSNSGGGARYVVIDLGQSRQFNTAYVYQPQSDGRFTKVQLAVSTVPLPYADAGWTAAGSALTVAETDYAPKRISLGNITARYVRVQVTNTGAATPSYVEIRGLQLFFE